MSRTVILVPRREGIPDRDALWRWCRAWWEREFPDLPIVEGHHEDGLFNRSAALNRASEQAGPWDTAILIDADIICDAARVREAIDLSQRMGRVVLPFTVRYNLNQFGSRLVMSGEAGSWKAWVAKTYTDMCSSCVVVPRAIWDAVGGFDEEFRGWGFEDTAFAAAAETFSGPMLYIHGELWHLFHRTAPEGRKGTPSHRANRARALRYESAWGQPEAMRAILDGPLEAAA